MLSIKQHVHHHLPCFSCEVWKKNQTRNLLMLWSIIAVAVSLLGCAHINPKADPLIVRAEQTEQIADSTFGLFLHLEDQNHALVKLHAPKVTAFAEWLRVSQPVHGTNMPRASALIFSLNDVKASYRASKTLSNSNLLDTAVSTLTEALNQAKQWTTLLNSTNSPTN